MQTIVIVYQIDDRHMLLCFTTKICWFLELLPCPQAGWRVPIQCLAPAPYAPPPLGMSVWYLDSSAWEAQRCRRAAEEDPAENGCVMLSASIEVPHAIANPKPQLGNTPFYTPRLGFNTVNVAGKNKMFFIISSRLRGL